MLRSVLGVYLDGLTKETDLHQLLRYLLPEMGYEKVALLHGPREHGRDLIAQREVAGVRTQYSFQAKLGDLKKKDVSELFHQVIEAAVTACPHPSFDAELPACIVVVTNGDIEKEGAALLAEAERGQIGKLGVRIEPWNRSMLLDLFERHATEPLLVRELRDVGSLGETLVLIGRAAKGEATLFELEEFSRRWLGDKSLFRPLLEAAVLRDACRQADTLYEALFIDLATTRLLSYRSEAEPELMSDTLEEQRRVLLRDVEALCNQAKEVLNSGDRLTTRLGSAAIVTGSVVCHRWMEAALLGYHLTPPGERDAFLILLKRLLDAFPQAMKPVSDKYAVTVFGIGVALIASGSTDAARSYVRSEAKWLFDSYQEPHVGLAGVDDDVQTEVNYLFGFRFSGVETQRRRCSLILTALLDIAMLLEDDALYDDLVNDSLAVKVHAEAFVVPETADRWLLTAESIQHISNLQVAESPASKQASHWIPPLPTTLPTWMFWAACVLLKDRWFPARLGQDHL